MFPLPRQLARINAKQTPQHCVLKGQSANIIQNRLNTKILEGSSERLSTSWTVRYSREMYVSLVNLAGA